MQPNAPIFAAGNPLLDILLHTDDAFLARYKLQRSGYTFWQEAQEGLYEEMMKSELAQYVAGGATLNSLRVCQGLSPLPGVVFYTGCIGKDEFGQKLFELCEREKMKVEFSYSDKHQTGVCGVTILDKERGLCTRLGASSDLTAENVTKFSHVLNRAYIAYIAGFVFANCPKAMLAVGRHCSETNKIFATNLSAPSIVDDCQEAIDEILPYADFLFGNHTEFLHFGKVRGWIDKGTATEGFASAIAEQDLLEEIGRRCILDVPKSNSQRPRIIAITRGKEPTLVLQRWPGTERLCKATYYPVAPLPFEDIVDSNAGGDAFVGGFLFGLLHFQDGVVTVSDTIDLDKCVRYAHIAARHIMQNSGCTFAFSEEEKRGVYPNAN